MYVRTDTRIPIMLHLHEGTNPVGNGNLVERLHDMRELAEGGTIPTCSNFFPISGEF